MADVDIIKPEKEEAIKILYITLILMGIFLFLWIMLYVFHEDVSIINEISDSENEEEAK